MMGFGFDVMNGVLFFYKLKFYDRLCVGFIMCYIDIDIDADIGLVTPDSAPDLFLHDNRLVSTQSCDSVIKQNGEYYRYVRLSYMLYYCS